MANKVKEAVKDANKVAVVADSASLEAEKKQAVVDARATLVYIASSLQNGMTFTDLKTAESGRVTIPGVNSRLQGAKHTIISTNLSMEQLSARYTPQVVSRLAGAYQELTFYGDDIRRMAR